MFFVHRSIEKDFVERVAERLSKAKVGNGLIDGIDAGPLIHHDACRNLGSKVEKAVASGARIAAENQSHRHDPDLREVVFFHRH